MMRPDLILRDVEAVVALAREADPDDETLLADMVEGHTDAYELLSALHDRYTYDDAMTAALKSQEAALKLRRGRIEARRDKTKAMCLVVVEACGVKSVELPAVTMGVTRRNPAVKVVDADALPDAFVDIVTTVTRKPNLAALKAHHASDKPLPDGAVLTNGSTHITFRV